MKQFNCLVLEDSLSDQLSIEMLLNQYPEIKPYYTNNPKDFEYEMANHEYKLIITDIKLKGNVTGIDLIRPIKDDSMWVIICSAYNSKKYYEQYKPLPFTKFYLQKPLDEFIFKTHIESFLFAKNEKVA
jgi:response regulator RpfG family c-di-GMP phosphodiesterase